MVSEDKVNELVLQTGCLPELAKMLLGFTGGDLHGAINIIKAVDKDIFILKMKFVAQTRKVFGAVVLQFNYKQGEVDNFTISVRMDDRRAIEFDLNNQWKDLKHNIMCFVSSFNNDPDLENKFDFMFANENFTRQLKNKMPLKKGDGAEALEEFLINSIAGLLQDIDIVLKLSIERTDVFEINKGEHIDLEEIEKDSFKPGHFNRQSELRNAKDSMILLKSDLVLDPVDGVPISALKAGDILKAHIIENSDIADYIKGLLSVKTPHVSSEKNKKKDDGWYFVDFDEMMDTDHGKLVKFNYGPGISGYTFFGEDVKVSTVKKELFPDRLPKIRKKGLLENLIVEYLWVVGGVLIFVIFLIIFIITK